MSLTKEITEQENSRQGTDRMELHLHKEGTFFRAYDWSAWLCCHYLHDFKVNKRMFKGIEQPVAFVGFPETSLQKWIPEGAEQRVEGEKHLVVRLPDIMVTDEIEVMQESYAGWKDSLPLTEVRQGLRKHGISKDVALDDDSCGDSSVTLTTIMQRVLAFPIESKSPLESMAFLADVKRQIATLI